MSQQIIQNKLVLPTTKSAVDNRWISQKMGMIGPPGVGKSEFWSHGDKTLFIQTEAGLNHLEVMKLVATSWADLREIVRALIQANEAGQFPYDTVVVDTMDKLKDLADEEAVARGVAKYTKQAGEINSVGDVPNGSGWMWSTQLMEKTLAKLEALPCCVAYIGHLSVKEVKGPTTSFHKQTISIGGKTGEMLAAWPDHFLNIEAEMRGDKVSRKIRTKPTSSVEAKSRGGVVPNGWVWSEDSAENYKKLRGLFK